MAQYVGGGEKKTTRISKKLSLNIESKNSKYIIIKQFFNRDIIINKIVF